MKTLREHAVELRDMLPDVDSGWDEDIERKLREIRNEALEEAAQALGQMGADNLVGGIRALKTNASGEYWTDVENIRETDALANSVSKDSEVKTVKRLRNERL